MSDWKDILSGKEEHANEDELIKYLEGKLSEEEKHTFERKTADSELMNDAVEGLSQFKSKQQLNEYVEQLNKNLHNQLDQRKKRKEKRKLKDNPWILVAVLLILALAIIAFVVVKMHNDNTSSSKAITGKAVIHSGKK
jgi:ferric-dicitrate binding protein FerR (iron transport regulator)